MQITQQELVKSFRTPAFPGSFLLSFEGIEGAGKSTQLVKIKEYLESKDFRVIVLREPGGTPFGEKLREAILTSNTELHPVAEAHLFASSRAQLMTEVTLKELSEPGTIVIYDRYIDSSLAYQGFARELGVETVLHLHQGFPLNIVPHKTIYLQIDLETSLERQKMRNLPKDYFESRDDSFHQKLIDGYSMACKLFPNRITVIDAQKNFDEVYLNIRTQIDSLIFNKED